MNEIKYIARILTIWQDHGSPRSEKRTAELEPWFDREGNLKGLRVATGEDDVFRYGDWVSKQFEEAVAVATAHLKADGVTEDEVLTSRIWKREVKGVTASYALSIETRAGTRKAGATAANGGLTGTPAPAGQPLRYIARVRVGEDTACGTVEPWFDREGRLVDFGPVAWEMTTTCVRRAEWDLYKATQAALKHLQGQEPRATGLIAQSGWEQVRFDADSGTETVTGEWARIDAVW